MQIPEAAPPANKKRRQSQIDTYNLMRDRISELPDDLLIRIVSILNLEESAITSTLSRRWKHLWRSCNRSFNFDGLERMNDIYRGGESLTLKEETYENLENLLSNCLMLERLHVVDSPRLVNVKLCNSRLRLKYFHILGCERLESLEVFAPNLVYFEYGIGLKVALNIRHAPQLRNVSAFGTNTLVMLQNHLFQLLTIHKRGNNQMMEWMMGWGENNDDNYRHQHLKEVEILGFQAFELDTEFVSWLLKSAVKLENLVIQTRNPDCQKRHVRHWLEDDQKRARKVAHLLAERWHPGVESMIL
ncbi:hypothetical protein COLO4_03298 [Corchorus olitorius]|uniref:F-box domain-containing protein n=1 Tax=Corchorus olitorius TaxID=93759 RepID=A0A1R3KZ92_9ROSI|nr:hypothetical protein COLO4_03298 [Corchorus olitorius]